MNAKEFFEQFKKNTKEETVVNKKMLPDNPELWEKETFLDIYRGKESIYTELINKYVIASIISGAGYISQHEYFRIDTVGWLSHYERMKNDCEKLNLNAHLWDLYIAVEHENSPKDWTDEVIKLVHIKCPLKVIVGYNYCDERDTKEWEKLNVISKWMQEVKALEKGVTEEYLIIFGNCYNPKTKADYNSFDYRGYWYNQLKHQFEKI